MGDEFISLKHMAQQNLSSIVAKQLQHTKLAIPDSQKQRVARLVDSHLRQHYSLMMKKLGLKKLVPYQQRYTSESVVVRESLNQDSSDEDDDDPLMQTVVRVHV